MPRRDSWLEFVVPALAVFRLKAVLRTSQSRFGEVACCCASETTWNKKASRMRKLRVAGLSSCWPPLRITPTQRSQRHRAAYLSLDMDRNVPVADGFGARSRHAIRGGPEIRLESSGQSAFDVPRPPENPAWKQAGESRRSRRLRSLQGTQRRDARRRHEQQGSRLSRRSSQRSLPRRADAGPIRQARLFHASDPQRRESRHGCRRETLASPQAA